MRVRDAASADVPRLIELVRATATGAQWSQEQFANMFAGEAERIVLVIEVEVSPENRATAEQEQIPRSVRNDKLTEEIVDRSVEGFAVAHVIASGHDPSGMGQTIGSECEIENVAVNPDWQRQGLGERLLDELLNRVQQRGCGDVFLEVRESNVAARRLYEKRGFRQVGRRVRYYSQPQEDAVVYRFTGNVYAAQTVQI